MFGKTRLVPLSLPLTIKITLKNIKYDLKTLVCSSNRKISFPLSHTSSLNPCQEVFCEFTFVDRQLFVLGPQGKFSYSLKYLKILITQREESS